MKVRWMKALLAAALLLLLGCGALAEEARDLTKECSFKGSNSTDQIKRIKDRNYESCWYSEAGSRARMQIALPEGETCGGVYLQFFNYSKPVEIRVQQGKEWVTVAQGSGDYLSEYIPLPEGISSFRICLPKGVGGSMDMAEVTVFSQGEVPAWVQRWDAPHEDADLLVITAHPDDEILFMGGSIPYYAGEVGKKVQVAYVTRSTPCRRLELLDGLWLCGVRNYPHICTFKDTYSTSLKVMYDRWNKKKVYKQFVEMYRRYKPEVVVTHDINGEYGHGAHKVAADAAIQALTLAADKTYEKESFKTYGTWDVPKLYIHLYGENVVDMDWRKPLAAFDGKTAFEMAEAAFQCHKSQLETEYKVEDFGPYDNSLFGLYRSLVGADKLGNDFFENIDGDVGLDIVVMEEIQLP